MAMALIAIGLLIAAVGHIMVLIEAFKTSAMWGVLSLIVPFASLVFVIKYWSVAKKGFLISLAGIPIYVIGAIMAASAAVANLPAA